MASHLYVALLRGINVGGKNIIRMGDLKTCFEGAGLLEVSTYIQSGNVIFRSPPGGAGRLVALVERALSTRFGFPVRVVIVPHGALRKAAAGAPKGFGKDPAKYRYDVIFLKPPLMAGEAMKSVSVKEGVDAATAGKEVLYFSRLVSRATESRLPKLITTPAYQNMTIRNWNTTVKLLTLMDGLADT